MPKNDHRQCHYSSDSSSYSSDDDSEFICKKCKKHNICSKCSTKCSTKCEESRKKKSKSCSKCSSNSASKQNHCSKWCSKKEDDDNTLDICDEKKNGNYIIITIK